MDLRKLKKEVFGNDTKVEEMLKQDLAFQVGREIERARLKAGLTQEALAKKIATHQSSIARAENGGGLQSLAFLKKIATAVGAHLSAPKFLFANNTKTLEATGICHDNKGYYCVDADRTPFSQQTKYSSKTTHKTLNQSQETLC